MKTKIDVIAGVESYNNLSSFKKIEEMNKTIRKYKDIISESVKRTDARSKLLQLIEVLKRHSCKFLGVSFLCKNKLATMLEVSYKTIQRMMKKLETLGMIKQIATKRKSDMLQTANAIVIVPVGENGQVSDKQVAEWPTKCPTNKTTSSSLKQNTINKRKDAREDESPTPQISDEIKFYDYSYVSSSVPKEFVMSVSPFFGEAKHIYRLWSRLQLAASKMNIDVYSYMPEFIKSFKEAIYAIKQNKNRNNDMFGYIFGTWRNTAAIICRRTNANKNGFYNWLEE